MTDVLVARGGFPDDTALMRLHHAAGLSVRTVEADLRGVTAAHIDSAYRARPACVIFAAVTDDVSEPGAVIDALRRLTHPYADIGFIAVTDELLDTEERPHLTASLFEAGADEVVSFDLAPRELAARVGAVVRRIRRSHPGGGVRDALDAARPRVDGERRELIGARARVRLTAKEATVMDVLASTRAVVGRDELGSSLWTGSWTGTAKAIDMHIANLRRKMPQACGQEWRIETVRGSGFVLVSGDADFPVTG